MKISYYFILTGAFFISGGCAKKMSTQNNGKTPEVWTLKDQKEYAARHTDSARWNMKMFRNDLEFIKNAKKDSAFIPPAISDYPSPVVAYDGNGSSLYPLRLTIKNKYITGYSVAHYRDKYKAPLFGKDSADYLPFFNYLILIDSASEGRSNAHVVSRNYPHYLFTGKQKTPFGNIDFVQMTLAGNENFAIIAQRYFDLHFGQTVLIAPCKDGSLRFLQIKDSPAAYRFRESSQKMNDFLKLLTQNKAVVQFFTKAETIDW
jgi:hypothetical protein